MTLLFKILAITGPAMFAGVMLAIGVILGGYWKSLPPAEFLDWFARNSGRIQSAIPLVVVPSLIGLFGMIWLDWSNAAARNLWIGAAGCILAVLAITVGYFVPSNAAFAARSIPVDQVSGKLNTWLMIHNLRIVLAVLASVLGVSATSR
jgi:Domain of unknown function (DUF1772)